MLIFHVDMNFTSLRGDYLRLWLKRLKGMGYTAVLWELEDKVAWGTCPECVSPEAFPKESFREILDYARSLGLENIPLLQTMGHAEYVLKHPEYHGWREDSDWHDCYCTTNPEVRSFLKKWIREILELFGPEIRQFHLGGDEAYRFATCENCRKRADELGRTALYAEHLSEVAAPLLEKGIVPGVWGDMLLAHPDQIEAMPRHFRIWDWNYWDGTDVPKKTLVWGSGMISGSAVTAETRARIPELMSDTGELQPFHSARFLKNRGWDVILCGSTRASGDSFFVGTHSLHARNVVGVAKAARREEMTGACVTSWGVRVHPWETQGAAIRMAADAWTDPGAEYETIEKRSIEACLGPVPASFLEELGKTVPLFRTRENGVQFNHLKDPVPAPSNYLPDLLRTWKEDAAQWAGLEREIGEGLERAKVLAKQLRAFDFNGVGEPAMVAALFQAARFQALAATIAAAVFRTVNGEASPGEGIAETAAAREAMTVWCGYWMTPKYAELIAGLVFGNIEAYLKTSRS